MSRPVVICKGSDLHISLHVIVTAPPVIIRQLPRYDAGARIVMGVAVPRVVARYVVFIFAGCEGFMDCMYVCLCQVGDGGFGGIRVH